MIYILNPQTLNSIDSMPTKKNHKKEKKKTLNKKTRI